MNKERIIAMEAGIQMQPSFPVFNGDDYEIWSIKMKTFLMSRDLWDVIENEELFKLQKDERIKDMSALYMLQMSVTGSIFFRIARAVSSKEAWELLKAEFGETERIQDQKKGFLAMMFENLVMEEEESVDEFIGRLMDLVNRLRFYGKNIRDEDVIFKIFQTFPSRFSESISYIRSTEDITMTEIIGILRADEWRQNAIRKNKRGRR